MPASSSENTGKLEDSLGFVFSNPGLLAEALTHRSFYHENPGRSDSYNERLEFLGDSVLGLVVVEHLFTRYPGLPESELAKIKSFLVKGAILSDIACEIDLGSLVRLGKGEEETGGRRKRSILADALEAVFGAVYLDGGLDRAREVILRLFRNRITSVVTGGTCYDYKTELQEKTQMLFGVLPEYRLAGQEGDEHRKTFLIEVFVRNDFYGSGTGKSKKEAQSAGAKQALERLARESGG